MEGSQEGENREVMSERKGRVDERRREEPWRLYFRTLRSMKPNRHVIH